MHARAPSSCVAAAFAVAATFLFAATIAATAETKPGREQRPRSPVAASDGETARGGGGRSLALVQADPSAGQTYREASSGVNLNFFCDTESSWYLAWYRNLKFCNFRDEMSYVTLPWQISNVNATGSMDDCPRTKEGCRDLGLVGLSLESCLENCGNAALLGGTCSEDDGCELGTFCKRMPGADEGICTACPSSPEECLADGVGTMASKKSCLQCELRCDYHYWGDFTVDGDVTWAYGITGSGRPTATGSVVAPLADCSDLALETVDDCPDAKDSICLIHEDYSDEDCGTSAVRDLAKKCENNGGLAMVLYYSACGSDDVPGNGAAFTSFPVNIPLIRISYDSGVALKQEKLRSLANVTTYDAVTDCWTQQYCSTKVPCMDDGLYCLFEEGRDEGMWCNACPEDPIDCLLPNEDTPFGALFTRNGAKSCVEECAANVKFDFGKSCKTCGDSTLMTEFFSHEDTSEQCFFCPGGVAYPDRSFPLFSIGESEITCRQVDDFFNTVGVSKDSKNCKLAQLQNYICGCQGTGYAGANTQAKRNALVWVPRVSAILSGLGSSFVLFDCMKTRSNRKKLFHKLMAQMALFDIIGSVAYAFTSLPIPSDTYIKGASGNAATCTAQGFFIQVGTVACFTNVSLAFYYYFVIQKGWTEGRQKKNQVWFFVCPVIVGMVFAFAGIPFYDNMQLWCNNAASWWPEIPVVVSIFISTVVMGSVCWDVRRTNIAARRWRQGGGGSTGDSLSARVFWQSFWYLMSFYMTWPPYLALQYLWASGKNFDSYGFILYAGTVVPLQGVWNFFVYARNRQLKAAREWISSFTPSLAASNISSNHHPISGSSSMPLQSSTKNSRHMPTVNEDTAITAQPNSQAATSQKSSATGSVRVSLAQDHNDVEDGPNGTSLETAGAEKIGEDGSVDKKDHP